MSADKYPCIFSRQMATIVYIIYINERRRRAGDVISYTSLFVGREKSLRCGSLCNERTRLAPIKAPGAEGGGVGGSYLRCLAPTSIY